jgi:preprotein translocase subunit SecG
MVVLYYIAVSLFIFCCFLLCSVILMQESKSMGLGASFGGDAGESVFGTATADVLKRFTTWLVAIFMGACLVLSFWTSAMEHAKRSQPTAIESETNGS